MLNQVQHDRLQVIAGLTRNLSTATILNALTHFSPANIRTLAINNTIPFSNKDATKVL